MHEGLGPKSGEDSWLEWSGEKEKTGGLEPRKLSDQIAREKMAA